MFTGNGLIANQGAIQKEFATKIAEVYRILETKGIVIPKDQQTIQNLPNVINQIQSLEYYANELEKIIGKE